MIDDGLDFAPRRYGHLGPYDVLAAYRRAEIARTVAIGILISLPALYLIGRYVVQWAWGW